MVDTAQEATAGNDTGKTKRKTQYQEDKENPQAPDIQRLAGKYYSTVQYMKYL